MKIAIVAPRCINIYQQRMAVNLISLMPEHDIEMVQPRKNLLARLKEMNPRIIYLICGFPEHGWVLELFKETDAITVSNGLPDTDIALDGEPEVVLPLLIDAVEQGKDFSEVPGITYRHKTKTAPKWDLKVQPAKKNNTFLAFSTRGCKGKCSFCCDRIRQGSLRNRDISDIIGEIGSFRDIEGFANAFKFVDLSFDSNPPARMKKILKAIIKELPGHTYGANFRPDFHRMADAELMELLYESGCTSAFIGVESANTTDLDFFNKNTSVEDAEKTIELFRGIDANIDIGFINFSPITTFQGLCENLSFLQTHHFATFETLKHRLSLSPGLSIKQKFVELGLPWNGWNYEFQDPVVKTVYAALYAVEEQLNKKAVELYSDINLWEVKRLKRSAVLSEDTEALKIVAKYEPIITDIMNRESDRLSVWFINLLEMVNNLKPPSEVKEMSDFFINDLHMAEVIRAYKGLGKSLRRELTEHYLCNRIFP